MGRGVLERRGFIAHNPGWQRGPRYEDFARHDELQESAEARHSVLPGT
jgi:hypothetical protein